MHIIALTRTVRAQPAASVEIVLRGAMMMNFAEPRDTISHAPDQPYAQSGLAIVRLTIGAMFVWVFFENLGKGLYSPAGYAG